MKKQKILITGFLGLAAIASGLLWPDGPTAVTARTMVDDTAQAPKYALLVGVNTYKAGSGITNLSGTHNDVALMRSLLSEFGFSEDLKTQTAPATAPCGDQKATSPLKTLCSEQATRDGILGAIDDHLVKNAKQFWQGKQPVPEKGPPVVFYYSGHGSYLPDDTPGEEADGFDETIVPHDSDTEGGRDIRDDAFEEKIRELKKYTSNVLIMSDSCHSGTIARGAGKKGFNRTFKTAAAGAGTRGQAGSTDNFTSDASYVAISGSLPTEYSYEDFLPDPVTKETRRNGLLTYNFVNQVRQNPGATYGEILKLVRTAVAATGRGQTPQIEGDVDRRVFGAMGARGKRPIAVVCGDKDGVTVCSEPEIRKDEGGSEYTVRKVKMEAGTIVGARVGGPVDIYSPSSVELSGPANKIASGTIVSADSFSSTAEVILTDAKAADLPPLAKAVLVAPMFSDKKRTVAIDLSSSGTNDAGVASMRTLSSNLKASKFLAPLEQTQILNTLNAMGTAPASPDRTIDWDVAVVRATYADFKLTLAKSAAKSGGPGDAEQGYFISDRSGNPLYNFWVAAAAPNAASRLQEALEKHVRIENIRTLSNESSPMANNVKVELVRLKNIEQAGENRCKVTEYSVDELAKLPPRTSMSRSDMFTLRVSNESSKRFHLYILSVDSAGAITRIFPPVAGAREELAPGVTYTNSGTCSMLFGFDETSPLGPETIKIIASERELPIDLMTQTAIKGGERSGPLSPLEKLFDQAMTQTRAKPFSSSGADWATVNIEYEVRP